MRRLLWVSLVVALVLTLVTPTAQAVRRSAKLALPATALEHATVSATATFTPARRGQRVLVELRVGRRWVVAAAGRQNARGRTTVRFAVRGPGTYTYRTRTVTAARRTLAVSPSRRIVVRPRPTRVASHHSNGAQGDGFSSEPSVSADGRWVTYSSSATNLAPGDTGSRSDVFLTDTTTGRTVLVSRTTAGRAGNGASGAPRISADGRYIAFASHASDLVPGDVNRVGDVFRFDRRTGQVVRVSVPAHSGGSSADSGQPAISGDGRFVAFVSQATNLTLDGMVSGGPYRAYLSDLDAGSTAMITRSHTSGTPAGGVVSAPSVSADGRFVAYSSGDPTLVTGDDNGDDDVFVHDRVGQVTRRVSLPLLGQADGDSRDPAISADGRYVAYVSDATNLVAGETNRTTSVYRTSLVDGATVRVSRAAGGGWPSRPADSPAISGNGAVVGYQSAAANVVPTATTGTLQVFAHTVGTGRTRLVSVNLRGRAGNGGSFGVALDRIGATVAFVSAATDLVPRDRNGRSDVFVRRTTG